MARIFVDLDGVLCDFDKGAEAALGMPFAEHRQLHGEALTWRKLELTADYYRRLCWMRGGKTLWRELNESTTWDGPPPMILTGLPLGTWAEPQKREWCRINLGEGVAVHCCLSRDKARYACPSDILIDDREEARLAWEEAGGVFIHHTGTATASLAALAEVLTAEPQEGTPP